MTWIAIAVAVGMFIGAAIVIGLVMWHMRNFMG